MPRNYQAGNVFKVKTNLRGWGILTRLRVYELAKQLGISSKRLISILKDLDIDVKNHMSSLDEETSQLVIDLFNEEKEKNKAKKNENKESEVNEKMVNGTEQSTKKVITLPENQCKRTRQRMNIEPVKIIKTHGLWSYGKYKCGN